MAAVLVIDDDDGIREMLDLALSSHGHAVTSVASGAAGLASIADRSPDVILLDLHLRTDDARLASEVKARTGAPIILMSASEPSAAEAGLGDCWLAKPFDLARLLRLIAECAARPG